MILRHPLYLYFVKRKALLDTLIVVLLDIIYILYSYIYSYIYYSLIFACFVYYSPVFVCFWMYVAMYVHDELYIYIHIYIYIIHILYIGMSCIILSRINETTMNLLLKVSRFFHIYMVKSKLISVMALKTCFSWHLSIKKG